MTSPEDKKSSQRNHLKNKSVNKDIYEDERSFTKKIDEKWEDWEVSEDE